MFTASKNPYDDFTSSSSADEEDDHDYQDHGFASVRGSSDVQHDATRSRSKELSAVPAMAASASSLETGIVACERGANECPQIKDMLLVGTLPTTEQTVWEKHVISSPCKLSANEATKGHLDTDDERRPFHQAAYKNELQELQQEGRALSDKSLDANGATPPPSQPSQAMSSPTRHRARFESINQAPFEWVNAVLRLLKAHRRTHLLHRDKDVVAIPRMQAICLGTKWGATDLLLDPSVALDCDDVGAGEGIGAVNEPRLVVWGYNGQLSKSRRQDPKFNRAVASQFRELDNICRLHKIPHVYLGNVEEKISSLFPDLISSPERHNVIGAALLRVLPDSEPELARIVEFARALCDEFSRHDDVSSENVTATTKPKTVVRDLTTQGKKSQDLTTQGNDAALALSWNRSATQLSALDGEMKEELVRGGREGCTPGSDYYAPNSAPSQLEKRPQDSLDVISYVDAGGGGTRTPGMWVSSLFEQLRAYKRRVGVFTIEEKRIQNDTVTSHGALTEESRAATAKIMPLEPSMTRKALESLLALSDRPNSTSHVKDSEKVRMKPFLVLWGFDAKRHKGGSLQHPQINASVARQFQALDDICRNRAIPHINMGDVGNKFFTLFSSLEPIHRSNVIGAAILGDSSHHDVVLASIIRRAPDLHELLSRNVPPLILTKNQKKVLNKAASDDAKTKLEKGEKRGVDPSDDSLAPQSPFRKKRRQGSVKVGQLAESGYCQPLPLALPNAQPSTQPTIDGETRDVCCDESTSFQRRQWAPPATADDEDAFARPMSDLQSLCTSLCVPPSCDTLRLPASPTIEISGELSDSAGPGAHHDSNYAFDGSTNGGGLNSGMVSSEGRIDQANLRLDPRIFLLEEEAKALDAALSSLSASDKTISKLLRDEVSKLSKLQSKMSTLHLRVLKLQASSVLQASLCGKVSGALAKSRGSLSRLLSSDEVSEQEMADLVACVGESDDQETLEECSDAKVLQSEQGLSAVSTSQASLSRMPQMKLLEDPSLSVFAANVKRHRTRPIRSIYQLNGKRYLVPYSEVDDRSWLGFWKDRNFDVKIGGFFPCLRSKRVLNAALDISSREMVALDAQFFPSARHRKEALGNTCLDARLIPGIPIKSEVQRSLSGASAVPAPGINPSVALCPYELTGACADPDCHFQHLQERSAGSLLAREYLVLQPPLGVCRRDETKSNRNSSRRKTFRPNRETEGDSTDQSMIHDAVMRNDDFIGLPLPAVSGTTNVHAQSSDRIEGCHSNHCWIWWNFHSTPAAEVQRNPDRATSFTAVLKRYGFELSGNNFSMETPLDVLAACIFCGKVTEATRLAIHAGRHDFAKSLLTFFHDVVVAWDNLNSSLVTKFKAVALKATSTLSDVQRLAFAFDAVPTKSSIRVAAESQMISAVLSFLFYHLFNTIQENGNSFPLGDVDTLLEDMDGILSRLNDVLVADGANESPKKSPASEMLTFLVEDMMKTPEIPVEVRSTSSLIESYIQPCWEKAKELLATTGYCQSIGSKYYVYLRVVLRTVNVSLCALEWTMASSASGSSELVVKSELAILQGSLCKVTSWLESITSCSPTFDFIITPLIASHITLLCANQTYDRAQSILSRFLASTRDAETSTTDRLFHLSEYLWSQLLQLRMTLPPFVRPNDLKCSPAFLLTEPVSEANKLLADSVDALEVHPHHVSMFGDWNLVRGAALFGRTRAELLKPFLEIVLAQHNLLSMRLSLKGCPLELRYPSGDAALPALPHALLLTGASTVRLDLTCCRLTVLPFHFGRYFPVLEVLNLGRNSLKELPSSVVHIECLAILTIESNEIEYLPSDFRFPRLTELLAQDNRLRNLPESIRECRELQILNLSRNRFSSYDFASLATDLPKLHTLTTESVCGVQ